MNIDSIGGSKYILTFTDDYTRYVTVYFLKNKSEVYEKFQEYISMVENITGLKVKTLRTDNGGEYVSNDFCEYCVNKGIVHQSRPLHSRAKWCFGKIKSNTHGIFQVHDISCEHANQRLGRSCQHSCVLTQ